MVAVTEAHSWDELMLDRTIMQPKDGFDCSENMTQELIIERGRANAHYWRDLWRYRELFGVLAWRDLTIRYKETAFGVLWALGRPFLTMLVLSFVFGKLAKLPSDGNVPYPLMVLAGMLVWSFFSGGLTDAANSIIKDSGLITKVYFPRMIVPAASVVVAFVDFLISLATLAILMIWYQFIPSWQIIILPLFIALAFLASLGPGLWVSALNIKYRDFRFVVPFLVQFGLYISPVGFSSNIVPDKWRFIFSLNPIVGIIDGFRWCIFSGQGGIYLPGVFWSVIATTICLWFGVRQFRNVERRLADLI
jgi:lipopolysaccharide transport system permease protein